jgi:hypothetical protein
LIPNDGGIRVIRQKGERLYNRYVLPTFKFGKGSVMVWGCFWAGGFGPLVTLKGKVDQEKYVKCLEEHFLPWYNESKEKYGYEFVLQEDGASCYTGSYTSRWKREAGITLMESWPAQIPDMNPIENLWYHLGKRIAKRRAQIFSLDQLEDVIHEEWKKLDEELFPKLALSRRERCEAVTS